MRTFLLCLMMLCIVIFTVESCVRGLLVRDVPIQRVEIPKGSSTREIARVLKENGVIGSEWFFILNVRGQGIERKLKPGNYRFTGRLSMNSVIAKLLKGQNELIRVTIPEGLTMDETFDIFQKSGVGNRKILLELANDPTFASELAGISVPSLEGFLYPETYMMPVNLKEETILRILTDQYHKSVDKILLDASGTLDPYPTLILASIIEREAKAVDEKPLMASVYLNRLQRGQRMEACPTVLYAWRQRGVVKNRLLYADLDIDSPYNTYRHQGLPPGPICSPSAQSVAAVRNPAKSGYLFFHTIGDTGRHIFTRTLAEHNATRSRS